MQRIAFIGLGAMGEPMAANLLSRGFPVTIVKHRRAEPVDRLRQQGARVVDTPAAAAAGCDVAVLMLPSSREVEAVLTGAGGMAAALPPGSLVLDCSTSDPASTRRLAAMLADKKVAIVDAGVTRGVAGAKQAKLAYFVGGAEEDVARVRPVLDAMGDTVFHMGPVGAGHVTKSLSNALSYGTVALVGEMLMIGEKEGIDLKALQEALMAGAASKALESFGPRIIAHEYQPARVSIGNARQHLGVTETLLPKGGKLTLTVAAHKVFDEAAAKGHDGSDIASIAELWHR